MAYLKEDLEFTHIIAIDFGTGASGFHPNKTIEFLLIIFNIKLWNSPTNNG